MFKPYGLLPQPLKDALLKLERLRMQRDMLNEEYDRAQQTVVDHMQALSLTSAGLPGERQAKLVSTYRLKVVDREGALKWLIDHNKVLAVCNLSTGLLNKESRAHPSEYLQFLEHGFVNVTPSQQIRFSKTEGPVLSNVVAQGAHRMRIEDVSE